MTGTQSRWGVIGVGHIAGVFAQDLTVTTSGRVVAVGSRTQEATASNSAGR
jgi:predicted dehydrogenase